MHLLPGAVALGVLHIEESLINEGTRGGNVSGRGSIDDRKGSTVRRPDRSLPDGTTVNMSYELRTDVIQSCRSRQTSVRWGFLPPAALPIPAPRTENSFVADKCLR
jgi:hypothetical protein